MRQKNHLPELFAKAEQGEQITITRHSKAIARLVPVESVRQNDVSEVITEIKSLAKWRHADKPIRDMIVEGRRGTIL